MLIIIEPLNVFQSFRIASDIVSLVFISFRLDIPIAQEIGGNFIAGPEKQLFSIIGKLHSFRGFANLFEIIIAFALVENNQFFIPGEHGDSGFVINNQFFY